MTNSLQFWTLQHLYVILTLSDIREIGDILEINHVFSLLHPEVERMEEKQNALRDRVEPFMKKRKELAELRKARETEGKNAADIIDRQEKLDKELKELDLELQSIQGTTPEFEWTPEAIATIREVVPHVFEKLGTQHDQLSGYRRIKATAEIIELFQIPSASL
jgi:seryl-tRNA synthetase